MTSEIVWLYEAADEYRRAVRWHASISKSLSEQFLDAVEDTLQTIRNYPLRFPIVSGNRRRAIVRRFPYGIVFLVEDTRIVVIACFHGKRNPLDWQNR